MNPARVDREDERRMLPCRDFMNGHCPRGSRCRFFHPTSSIPALIRVPNLPTSFHQNNFAQILGGARNVIAIRPARHQMGRRLGGLRPPVSARFLAEIRELGNSYRRSRSPTYSEYEMAYAQLMEIQKERERRAAAAPENNDNGQDTVFKHIDWKEFLAPGAQPPRPSHMGNSPGRDAETLDSLESSIRAGNSKSSRPLSAKEELQMKVKQIAKHLATETAQPVQSMDIFFRNSTFESVPTAPSSEQDLVGNSGEIEEETPRATITEETEPLKVESDSGISSSELTSSSGDSASSMESVKDENSSEKSSQA